MKSFFPIVALTSLLVGSTCLAEAVADDDEYEEVVVRRKKKRPPTTESSAPVAVAPVAVVVPAVVAIPAATTAAPAAAPASAIDADEPPPPPEPPAADAAEPRRLVRYFCKAWKDKDYERLWWAMSKQYRKKVSLKKFKKIFEGDAERTGGLLDENILEKAKTRDGNEGVKVELIFRFPRAKHRIVMAIAERQAGGAFRLVSSPFIPLDLDDL